MKYRVEYTTPSMAFGPGMIYPHEMVEAASKEEAIGKVILKLRPTHSVVRIGGAIDIISVEEHNPFKEMQDFVRQQMRAISESLRVPAEILSWASETVPIDVMDGPGPWWRVTHLANSPRRTCVFRTTVDGRPIEITYKEV